MGARLRLKSSVGGADPVLRTSDPYVQRIFRAMQKHGLIVADNGSDLYVSGTFDTRWNNDVLNPAFRLLTADDFEVVELGWNPVGAAPALSAVSVSPAGVTGGNPASGSVVLSAPAPADGAVVGLASSSPAALVPSSVAVAGGATTASFAITTRSVTTATAAVLTATYAGISRSAMLTVQPVVAAVPSSLALQPSRVVGGMVATGTVRLSAAAPAGGLALALSSSNPSLAAVPGSVTVAAGASSATFPVTTVSVTRNRSVTLNATGAGRTVFATLSIVRR